MVVEILPDLLDKLSNCPEEFKLKFRMAYQQLRVVDKPMDIKGVNKINRNPKKFRLYVDKSRISMAWDGEKLLITRFLYNQFLIDEDND